MSILVNNNTKLMVQGITGSQGLFHATQCRDYGTNVIGGVTPGKGGSKVEGFHVFNSVSEAKTKTGANTSLIFVPAAFAPDAILEAVDAGIELVICITEGIPTNDMSNVKNIKAPIIVEVANGPVTSDADLELEKSDILVIPDMNLSLFP